MNKQSSICKIDTNGTKTWAIEYADGRKFWYINDNLIKDPNKCHHDCCKNNQ